MLQSYINGYLQETKDIAQALQTTKVGVIMRMVDILAQLRQRRGRLFIVGVGGGAGNGSHAANDFLKISGLPTLNLSDNVSVLTALANDEGWDSVFVRQLMMHQATANDCLLVFSVGGGTDTTSANIAKAVTHAAHINMPILGVVGKDSGYTAKLGTAVLVIPTEAIERITPHTESWQMIINHLLSNALAQIPLAVPASASEAGRGRGI